MTMASAERSRAITSRVAMQPLMEGVVQTVFPNHIAELIEERILAFTSESAPVLITRHGRLLS